MNIVELFSGTGNLSRIARDRGHSTFTLDMNEDSDYPFDILTVSATELLQASGFDKVDMIWASPPCDGFSVITIGRMWTKEKYSYKPKHPTSKLGLELIHKTLEIIDELNPKVWFIENPRGMMRKMEFMPKSRTTVTYCQYGEERMKPTDIWFSKSLRGIWKPKPPCSNGDTCHVAAPRGSQTGTQGIRGSKLRSKLPDALCLEVIQAAEELSR
jgi:site-specific DNA-cytosine methylase